MGNLEVVGVEVIGSYCDIRSSVFSIMTIYWFLFLPFYVIIYCRINSFIPLFIYSFITRESK
ncbi:hypothetical protein CROQUDRAFT_705624 [Cronartium quercuum f. sp. fusiforme G11]|uniref:Uncharacterized protein n=1 Tax=Cronartium quercuum f. sp. fusiforme G11 TaxID=708437 RepID=A0A9P6T4U6_9BASI|nr:hypothetical protein CROQUDRAFT_705624 [Cronartium quercuum f. sp. fusiforme G11]